MIDTGHNGEIVPLLRSRGVLRIDLLILSHPHSDHTGGLSAIVRALPVSETWYAGHYRGRARETLAELSSAEAVTAGRVKTLGRLSLTVLHPEPNGVPSGGGESEVNNGSLVVKAVYDDTRYLFPGDCELGCWEEMFKLHRSELRSDILKAAHHGSWNGTNSGVLINVHPATIVVSCGRDNRYGHPHELVLKMIQRLRAKVFRTDQQGTIHCLGAECKAGA